MAALAAASALDKYASLSNAYLDYKGCLECPSNVNSRVKLASLTETLQKQGIHGRSALQLLAELKPNIAWQMMAPEEFRRFYQFVFFVCREQGKRNVERDVAVGAWRELLEGRFRLLDRWCVFVNDKQHYKLGIVSEDTWVQVLEFSRTVHEDLSNYDATAAWPVSLDEFVEHLRHAAKKGLEPMDLSAAWPAEQVLSAVSPHSGSKRRMPLVEAAEAAEVAEKLQHLPLACTSTQQQQPYGAVSRQGQQVVKRYCVAAPLPPAAPSLAATAQPAGITAVGFHSHQPARIQASSHAVQPGATLNAGLDSSSRPEGLLQSMGIAPPSSTAGWPEHMKQQPHHALMAAGAQQAASGLGCRVSIVGSDLPLAATADAGLKAASCGGPWQPPLQVCPNNMGGGSQQTPGATPLQPRRGAHTDAPRCSGVNAMVQATITDTLFFT